MPQGATKFAPQGVRSGRGRWWTGFWFLSLLGLLALGIGMVQAATFLSPEQAFQFSAKNLGQGRLQVTWTVAPGYHLYRDPTRLTVAPSSVVLGTWSLPPGKLLNDPAFGKVMVLEGRNRVIIPYTFHGTAPKTFTITSTYLGCANAGVCYPQQHKSITLPAEVASTPAAPTSSGSPPPAVSNAHALSQGLAQRFWWTLGLFFLSGLGLAFTPCVFPMIPILSGIIVGQRAPVGKARAFLLSAAYVLGMALTYTLAGVAAALTGAYLTAFFQNPWIIGTFAAIFVLLALSMFGLYELQMPVAIQSRASRWGKGGHLLSSFVLGILSALIVGPCVAAPLAGGLLFISQTGNVFLGGLSLFVLSLGMGLPLLLIGTSAGQLLPKAGAWMEGIRAIFGILMLGVAIWFLSRIAPGGISLLLYALLAIFAATHLGALEPAPKGWARTRKALGLALLIWGVAMVWGAMAGQDDPLHPLPVYHPPASAPGPTLQFLTVRSVPALTAALNAARGRHVLVDYWASWCVECQRMDHIAFQNPEVQKALQGAVLIRVDVSADDAASRALLQRYHLAGPPAFIQISPEGRVTQVHEAYLGPDAFLHWWQQAVAS